MARGMCQFDVTTISELKSCSRAQRRVSIALPKVLSAERSRSMQQAKILFDRAASGARFRCALVVRMHAGDQQPLAALRRRAIRSRRGCARRRRSARRCRRPCGRAALSSVRHLPDEPEKPAAEQHQRRRRTAVMVKKADPARKAREHLVDRLQRAVDRVPRGQGGHHRDQHDLRPAPPHSRSRRSRSAEQRRRLLAGRACRQTSG